MTLPFLHSGVADPFPHYHQMLSRDPVCFDAVSGLWVLYSHTACSQILLHPDARVPAMVPWNRQDPGPADFIRLRLARLTEGPQHKISRQLAGYLFSSPRYPVAEEILFSLLPVKDPGAGKAPEWDWVEKVCKRLPLALLLSGFGFDGREAGFFTKNLGGLLKLMQAEGSAADASLMNEVAATALQLARDQVCQLGGMVPLMEELAREFGLSREEVLSIAAANMLGLLIQCHDAGRGLLCNSLLCALRHRAASGELWSDSQRLQKWIVETLRFEPPIHLTRRVAAADINLLGKTIKKGALMLLVLAAANRDPAKFSRPEQFDPDRHNNSENLSFGLGAHQCLAKHFSMDLTAKCLAALFQRHPDLKLAGPVNAFEPLSNARLAKNLWLSV